MLSRQQHSLPLVLWGALARLRRSSCANAAKLRSPAHGLQLQVVVVSRWFGGVLLGPERFRHINNAGRQILVQCGYSSKEK